MLTKADKTAVLKALKMVDVKKLELDHPNPNMVKWFRFGSFTGIDIASQIIMSMPEESTRKKIKVT